MNQNRRKRQKVRSIGEQLEKIAHERKLSYRNLAELAGVSTSVIGSWMGVGGAAPSDLSKVKHLSDAMSVDFAWLVLGEQSNCSQFSISEEFEESPNKT